MVPSRRSFSSIVSSPPSRPSLEFALAPSVTFTGRWSSTHQSLKRKSSLPSSASWVQDRSVSTPPLYWFAHPFLFAAEDLVPSRKRRWREGGQRNQIACPLFERKDFARVKNWLVEGQDFLRRGSKLQSGEEAGEGRIEEFPFKFSPSFSSSAFPHLLPC